MPKAIGAMSASIRGKRFTFLFLETLSIWALQGYLARKKHPAP